jgi:hypothetical protein
MLYEINAKVNALADIKIPVQTKTAQLDVLGPAIPNMNAQNSLENYILHNEYSTTLQ